MKDKIASAIILLCMMQAADATVLGVGPAKLQFTGAQRGGYYTGYITASTTDKTVYCQAKATGATADWLTIDPQTFTLTPDAQKKIQISVKVPESQPNGKYDGAIEVRTLPPPGSIGGTGMNIGAAIYISTEIDVTGEEGDWFRVMRVAVSNPKEGDPIKTEVTFKNNGANPVKPLITLKAMSRDKQKTYSTSSLSRETITPMTRQIVTTYLPSTDLKAGLYYMDFTVDVEGKEIWNSEEPFYIMAPENTQPVLKMEGVMDDAYISNANITLSQPTTINAQFRNSGDIPLDAKLRVDIIKEGKIIKSLEGPTETLDAGKEKTTNLTYKPDEAGEQTLRIWVEYSGQRTAVREAKINVWTYTKPIFDFNLNFYLLAVPAALLIIAWLLMYYRKYY